MLCTKLHITYRVLSIDQLIYIKNKNTSLYKSFIKCINLLGEFENDLYYFDDILDMNYENTLYAILCIHNNKVINTTIIFKKIQYKHPYIYISSVFTLEKYRNRGVARKTIEKIFTLNLDWMNNITNYMLECKANNYIAKNLYNSLGFYVVENDNDTLIMTRNKR